MDVLAEVRAILPEAGFENALEAAEYFALLGDTRAFADSAILEQVSKLGESELVGRLNAAFRTSYRSLVSFVVHMVLLHGFEGLMMVRDRLEEGGAGGEQVAGLSALYAGVMRLAQAEGLRSLYAQTNKQLATVLGASCLRQGIRECLANGEEVDVLYGALDQRFGRALYQGCLDQLERLLYDEMARAGVRLRARAALRVV